MAAGYEKRRQTERAHSWRGCGELAQPLPSRVPGPAPACFRHSAFPLSCREHPGLGLDALLPSCLQEASPRAAGGPHPCGGSGPQTDRELGGRGCPEGLACSPPASHPGLPKIGHLSVCELSLENSVMSALEPWMPALRARLAASRWNNSLPEALPQDACSVPTSSSPELKAAPVVVVATRETNQDPSCFQVPSACPLAAGQSRPSLRR